MFIFIAATVGLLGWAAVRPWVGKWYEVGFHGGVVIGICDADVCGCSSERESGGVIYLYRPASIKEWDGIYDW